MVKLIESPVALHSITIIENEAPRSLPPPYPQWKQLSMFEHLRIMQQFLLLIVSYKRVEEHKVSIEIIYGILATPDSQCHMQFISLIFTYISTRSNNNNISNNQTLALNVVSPSQTDAPSLVEQVDCGLTASNHYHGDWMMA